MSEIIKHKGYWATVFKESGEIRDITYASNSEMAKTLLTSRYTKELKELVDIKPVKVTVIN
jgi:hypothetical protein